MGLSEGTVPGSPHPRSVRMTDNGDGTGNPSVGLFDSLGNGLKSSVSGVVAAVAGWLNVIPGAQYLAAGATLADTQWSSLLATINGFLKVSLGDFIAGEDLTNNRMRIYAPNGYTHLSALGTTTIKSGAGTLRGVTINTKGATANTCTIYDNTAGSGTVIAVIDTTREQAFYPFDVQFGVGLTIVLAAGTSADITVASF